MKSQTRPYRRRRSLTVPLVLLAVTAGLVWTLYARATGRPLVPVAIQGLMVGTADAAEPTTPGPGEPAEGMVRVPVSGRLVPAYSRLTRDDVWNARAGRLAFVDIRLETAEASGVYTDLGDVLGRVLANDKQPGYVFTEADFLPEGTRPGMVAGIPPGKRAMRVEVETVAGIVGLHPGDRFDIVAALSLGTSRVDAPAMAGVYGAVLSAEQELRRSEPRARVRVLVQNGIVVSPLTIRQVPTTSTTLTQGTRTRTIPKQEMVIAVAPEEVAALMEAIAVGAEITCLARSGHPDDPLDAETPSESSSGLLEGARPSSFWPSSGVDGDFTLVESLSGSSRQLVPVRRPAER